ncbi:Uncharacterized protein SCG7109_AO_00090 [Chlamydiales bacterium SCGC AG-110-M15]|nr:Uncharacterized protein SCG7109_AO_00090 [Chlamydiales bacterium SCGC AG-110-M15]
MAVSDSLNVLEGFVGSVRRLLMRWRYPFTLPEDILSVLGVDDIGGSLSFHDFMHVLSSPECRPQRLVRLMSRNDAEAVFSTALKKERFQNETLFSFYFEESWVEFILHFDSDSRLRRIYLHHNGLSVDEGVEINLPRKREPTAKLVCS